MLTEQMRSDLTSQGHRGIPCFDCNDAQTVLANGDARAILCENINISYKNAPYLHVIEMMESDCTRIMAKTAVIFTHPEFKDFACRCR